MPLINPDPTGIWFNLTPAPGWTSQIQPQYSTRRSMVWLRGQLSRPASQLTALQTILTVPIAPSSMLIFPVDQVGAPGARVDLQSTGALQIFWDASRGTPQFADGLVYVSLSGILYPTW